VALAPHKPEVHREFARWLLDSGGKGEDAQCAEAEARQAVALDPKDALAQMALGRALLDNRHQQAGIEALKQAAMLAPNGPNAPFILAQAYKSAGMKREAQQWEQITRDRQRYVDRERALLDRLRIDPRDIEAHQKLIRLYGQHGEVAGAVEHAA